METAEGHAADENSLNITGTVLRARVTRKGSVVFVIRTSGRDAKHRNCLVKATASPYISSDIITMMPAEPGYPFRDTAADTALFVMAW